MQTKQFRAHTPKHLYWATTLQVALFLPPGPGTSWLGPGSMPQNLLKLLKLANPKYISPLTLTCYFRGNHYEGSSSRSLLPQPPGLSAFLVAPSCSVSPLLWDLGVEQAIFQWQLSPDMVAYNTWRIIKPILQTNKQTAIFLSGEQAGSWPSECVEIQPCFKPCPNRGGGGMFPLAQRQLWASSNSVPSFHLFERVSSFIKCAYWATCWLCFPDLRFSNSRETHHGTLEIVSHVPHVSTRHNFSPLSLLVRLTWSGRSYLLVLCKLWSAVLLALFLSMNLSPAVGV